MRKLSHLSLLTNAAKKGVCVRVTLPDGTMIENLTGSNSATPMPTLRETIAARIDEIPTSKVRPRGHGQVR